MGGREEGKEEEEGVGEELGGEDGYRMEPEGWNWEFEEVPRTAALDTRHLPVKSARSIILLEV